MFAGLGVVSLLAGGSAALAAQAGRTPDNSTPQGWRIRPAGQQVGTLRFPLGVTSTPDGKYVIATEDSGGPQGLTVVDTATYQSTTTTAANLFMGATPTPDGHIFASGGNADRVFRFQLAPGGVAAPLDATEAATAPTHAVTNGAINQFNANSSSRGGPAVPSQPAPAGDGLEVHGYPGNSVLDGKYLYVAGTLSEAGGTPTVCPSAQPACARVTVIDTTANGGMGAVVGRIPVGLDAYGLAVDAARHRLYVSNWADEAGRGGSGGGTVSVVDITDPANAKTSKEIAFTGVGHHPSAVQLSADRTRLFVANTNDDSISVLDVTRPGAPAVVATESVRPVVGVPVGAHPNAFALAPDGKTLYVALAGLNAVEVLDGRTGARVAGHPMYIPTGWYPAALTVTGTADHFQLWVANAKGEGPGPGANGTVFFDGTKTGGSLSAISFPVSAAQMNRWTAEVVDNDHLERVKVNACRPGDGIQVSEVLCPPKGLASPIKHVLYIVVENKTFDQYFGDLDPAKGYDADPSWSLYGRNVTTNQHALVEGVNGGKPYGSLDDRFFSDAEVSVTGHSWTSGGIATDHNEKTWAADYDQGLRGTHGGGDPLRPSVGQAADKKIAEADDELQDPEGGYIFEAFKDAGATPPSDNPGKLSMAIYGERTARESGDMDAYKAPHWKDGDIQYFDTCRAMQFVSGKAPNGPSPDGTPADPYFADCQGRTLPGQFNLAHWTDVKNKTGRDVMPNFLYMSLPVNHTVGTNLGSPTPASMVADNDYAIGLIVDALSKSPFWSSTAIMITQDDTQAAGDHVSALRDYLQVVSPWARPGAQHQWGSMPSLLRTIEVLFGVSPVSLNDRLAVPQHEAFLPKLSDQPNLATYDVQRPPVPFALNEPGAQGQAESASMDFSEVDRIDEQLLNAIQYADARGITLDEARRITGG